MADYANPQKSEMMPTPRVLSSWTRVLLDALNETGHDGMAIARQAGFKDGDFKDPNARFSLNLTNGFWKLAAEATGDESLGLWVSKYVKPTTFHALGLAAMASGTLFEAVKRMERYSEVVSDSEKITVALEDKHWSFCLTPRATSYRATPESLDAILSYIHRSARAIVEAYDRPLEVFLARPRPANAAAYGDLYKCPVWFDQPLSKVSMPLDIMDAPLATANDSLAEQSDMILNMYLDTHTDDPFETKLRKIIRDALPSGDVSLAMVAKELGRSERSLQRHLSESDRTFSAVVGDIRSELAQSYLKKTDLPITEIAFLIGYSDTGSFSRAFKSWTGQSPRNFQKENA